MNDKPIISLIQPLQGYADGLAELKSRIHSAQQAVGQLPWRYDLALIYRVQFPDFKLLVAKLYQSINRAKQRLLNKGEP